MGLVQKFVARVFSDFAGAVVSDAGGAVVVFPRMSAGVAGAGCVPLRSVVRVAMDLPLALQFSFYRVSRFAVDFPGLRDTTGEQKDSQNRNEF